jgi:imidazolonepropionase-like amidohydrolase
MKSRLAFLIVLAVGVAGCDPLPRPPATPAAAARHGTAFVDVHVLAPEGDRFIPHQTVIVAPGGRIAWIGDADQAHLGGAVPIAGRGTAYLVPGLADMHVHLPDPDAGAAEAAAFERALELSLASGVTLIRGMQGAPGQLAARARLAADADAPVMPELVLAGPPIREALTPEAARALVRDQHAAGYDLIKVLGGIDAAAYQALVDEAARAGIRIAGHVPAEIGIDAALAAKQSSIEHVQGYSAVVTAAPERLDALVQQTVAAGVWNCPTLDFFAVVLTPDEPALRARDGIADYATDAELAAWHAQLTGSPPPTDGADRVARTRAITQALARAGAPLLVGSDSPDAYTLPGFGYVEELRQLALAGLSPAELLRAATRSAADYLGRSAELGRVAVGLRADLVLLDSDPLAGPRAGADAFARPLGVMARGAWQSRAELDARLARWRRGASDSVK